MIAGKKSGARVLYIRTPEELTPRAERRDSRNRVGSAPAREGCSARAVPEGDALQGAKGRAGDRARAAPPKQVLPEPKYLTLDEGAELLRFDATSKNPRKRFLWNWGRQS